MGIKKICVLGIGYIGLPTASLLATKGYNVIGVDVNEEIVRTINSGNVHIVEPYLDILVKSAVNSGNLKATTEPEEADVFIIAVPTPFKEKKEPDISYIEAAADSIIPLLREGNIVVLESTSPAGTTEKIASKIAKSRPELFHLTGGERFSINDSKIYIAYCPERVLPGKILKELVENDRIIGGINKESALKVKEFYKTFISGNIFLTDSRTAEMCKLMENAFRDVNIAFANELSMICEDLGINVWKVIELANRHPRVNILQPGPGVGGHCIAVDPLFIVSAAPEKARLIRTAREVNDHKPHHVFEKIKKVGEKFKSPVIGCLGLSYKNDIDDLRESPAVKIVRMLRDANIGKIMVCEPNLDNSEEFELFSLEEVLQKSNIIVLLTNHKEFYEIDRESLKEKIVIDTRGIWR